MLPSGDAWPDEINDTSGDYWNLRDIFDLYFFDFWSLQCPNKSLVNCWSSISQTPPISLIVLWVQIILCNPWIIHRVRSQSDHPNEESFDLDCSLIISDHRVVLRPLIWHSQQASIRSTEYLWSENTHHVCLFLSFPSSTLFRSISPLSLPLLYLSLFFLISHSTLFWISLSLTLPLVSSSFSPVFALVFGRFLFISSFFIRNGLFPHPQCGSIASLSSVLFPFLLSPSLSWSLPTASRTAQRQL